MKLELSEDAVGVLQTILQNQLKFHRDQAQLHISNAETLTRVDVELRNTLAGAQPPPLPQPQPSAVTPAAIIDGEGEKGK